MLAKKVEAALNEQLQEEFQSAYVYLAMSAWCEAQSLPGFGQWLRVQWQEELDHGMRFYGFILDRGAQVVLQKLDAPPVSYSSPLDVFEQALEHEREVTRSIDKLYELVMNEKDYASQAWLDWFATEQVEEEKTIGAIVDSLRRVGERGDALFLIDRELGGRVEQA